MNNLKILYITNIPSPYRVKYFNELSLYSDLTVIYERRNASDRDNRWKETSNNKYKEIYLKGLIFKNDFIISNGIKKHLKKNSYDCIVFCNYASPSGMLGIRYCLKHHIDYYIEGDGAFYDKKSFKDIIKRRLLKNSICCFSSCDNLDKYYLKHGVNKNRIVRYRFTSLTDEDIVSNQDNYFNKALLKKKLELNYEKVILFVGQFIYRKGIDILLKAFNNIVGDVALVIIGGNPQNSLFNIINYAHKRNVFFYDFMTKNELSDYFKSSDLFVLPTREDIWGLVVNEALSYGLPVITTNMCNAGLELIKNNYNGFVVERNDVDALVTSINCILSSDFNYKDNCLSSIKEYIISNMVKDHLVAFNNYGKK